MPVLARARFDALFAVLAGRGYSIIGPTVQGGAIVYDEVAATSDLPLGWTDEQEGGRYRLRRRDDEALFGFASGPRSFKRELFPPEVRLWRLGRKDDGFHVDEGPPVDVPRRAFLGVRSCDLAAIAIQDRVFLGSGVTDSVYAARRDGVFIVAVTCGEAGGTCFCVSMGTGPRAERGFDLALTELIDDDGHRFVLEPGSPLGAEVVAELPCHEATDADHAAAARAVAHARASQGRTLDTANIKELLYDNLEHPRWDDVASRCLSCANCTLVCPTCFCSTVEDITDLEGDHAERWRRWDSCFTLEHSSLHGHSVRGSIRSRYRQWLTHKLASWIDQFGTSGCVGCGRCITWCPVGIDLTEEVRAIRESSP